jgi:hypothetical protein
MSAPVCRHGIERVSGDWCEECETEVDVFDDDEDLHGNSFQYGNERPSSRSAHWSH